MRLWLVRKLASLTSEPNALLSQFKNLYERESADEEARVEAVQCDSASADFVEHWERTESQKKRINRDVEIALRWVHREACAEGCAAATDNEPHTPVRKRELFATLFEAPTCSWAVQLPQGMALAPLLLQHDFAIAFLLAPVEQPGYISVEEFVIFGLVVAEIEPKFHQVKEDLAAYRAASGTQRWTHQSADRDPSIETLPKDGSQRAIAQLAGTGTREDPGYWARAHTHIMVRFDIGPAYCCICRRNRASIQIETARKAESKWIARWSTTREHRLDELVPDIREEVDSRRRFRRLEESRRTEVALTLQNLLDSVSADEERGIITAAILEAIVSSIVLPRVPYTAHVKHNLYEKFGGALPSEARDGGSDALRLDQPKLSHVPVRVIVYASQDDGVNHLIAESNVPQDELTDPPMMPLLIDLGQGAALKLRIKHSRDAHCTPQLCVLSASGLRLQDDVSAKQSRRFEHKENNGMTQVLGGNSSTPTPAAPSPAIRPWAAPMFAPSSNILAPVSSGSFEESELRPIDNMEAMPALLNPFCAIYMQDTEVGRTRTAIKTCNPVWAKEDDDGPWVILKIRSAKRSPAQLRQLMIDSAKRIKMEATLAVQVSRQFDARDAELLRATLSRSGELDSGETERSMMATEERQTRAMVEGSLRKRENYLLHEQEEAQRSLHLLIGELTERGVTSFLTRLTWLESVLPTGGSSGPAAHVMLDPASGKSLLLRLLPLQYASDVEHVVSIAENLRDLRCHGIIRIVSVHSHEFTSFNLHGTCSQVWTLVAFVTSNIGSRCLTDQ
ncbi:C2 domain-containing protein, partial [bacterium]|nr:C2 domain-containing protein [bacterium]